LKSVAEIVRSVFEQHDKAKREENEKSEPKYAAQQRHAEEDKLVGLQGQTSIFRAQSSNLNGQLKLPS
jgi:hypothetical protein